MLLFCGIQRYWQLSKNDSNFVVYKKFVETVTLTTYENLQQFRQFADDKFLNGLDMLQIAKEVNPKSYLTPDSALTHATDTYSLSKYVSHFHVE